jgi:hypothetical protein
MSVAPRAHASQRRLRRGNQAQHIQLQHLPPATQISFGNGLQVHHAGVVDEDIETAEMRLGFLHDALRLRFMFDRIRHQHQWFSPLFGELLARSEPVFTARGNGHLGALLGQRQRGGFPDARGRASHQGDTVFQAILHASSR